jgi:hypothetical protein
VKRIVFAFLIIAAMPTCSMAQQNPFDALRDGMKLHSDSLVRVFFESWFRISEVQRKEPATVLQKEGEEIVEFLSINLTENHKSFAPYILINPIVKIYFDTSQRPEDSLQNMFPEKFLGSKTLVYNKKYVDAIERYLLGWQNKEREEVSKFTALSCHEGGCGVMFEPVISSIRFSQKNQTALVRSAMNERGWDITLSKADGQWKIIGRMMKWIE